MTSFTCIGGVQQWPYCQPSKSGYMAGKLPCVAVSSWVVTLARQVTHGSIAHLAHAVLLEAPKTCLKILPAHYMEQEGWYSYRTGGSMTGFRASCVGYTAKAVFPQSFTKLYLRHYDISWWFHPGRIRVTALRMYYHSSFIQNTTVIVSWTEINLMMQLYIIHT